MNRPTLLLSVALLTVLAGCSGGGSDSQPATESTTVVPDDPGPTDTNGDGGARTDGDSGATTTTPAGDEPQALPEIAMLQFDRDERYVYDVVYVGGTTGRTYIDVAVQDAEATINVTSVVGEQRLEDVYTVPTNDPDAVIDAMDGDIRRGGVGLLLQSQDVTNIFVENDLDWEVGTSYESFFGNVTVTGYDTIGGVDCLTYDFRVDGDLFEQGCLTADLESPVSWEKYLNDDDLQLSWTLVSYEQG